MSIPSCDSDREIIIKSGILEEVDKGDKFLADRGFTCQDLFKAKGAKLCLPPFLVNGQDLPLHHNQYGKILAKARCVILNLSILKIKLLVNGPLKCKIHQFHLHL